MLNIMKTTPLLLIASGLLFTACTGTPRPKAAQKAVVEKLDEVDRDRKALGDDKGWTIRKFDLNRDDIPDVFKFYGPTGEGEATAMLRKEIDLNHDNRVDVVQLFDASGAKTSEHTDLDFDGRTDEISHFKEGSLILREIDFNYDGRVDISKKYVKGTLTLIESDRTGDGKVDTWEYFENGTVARIGVDRDADGIVDTWEQDKTAAPPVSASAPEAAQAPEAPATPAEEKPADTAAPAADE